MTNSDTDPREGDESGGEGRFHFRDKRRIDPKTGKLRHPSPSEGGADTSKSSVGGFADATSSAAAAGFAGSAANSVDAAASSAGGAESASSEELAAARAEAAERTADLQRITAEYANYRKRADRDKQQSVVVGKAAVVSEMLSVLDDFDRAGEHGDLTGGFKTVADKLTGTLERLGLSHFGAEGDEFDPNVHEAVQFATSADVQQPTVTTVLRRGYLFAERVLRPAVVMVTGPEDGDGGPDRGAEAGGGDRADSDSAAEAGADAVGDEPSSPVDDADDAATNAGESAAVGDN